MTIFIAAYVTIGLALAIAGFSKFDVSKLDANAQLNLQVLPDNWVKFVFIISIIMFVIFWLPLLLVNVVNWALGFEKKT